MRTCTQLGLALVLCLLCASPAVAVTFVVNSSGDDLGASVGNGRCETVPGNRVCTLRRALAEAQRLSGADPLGSTPPVTILLDVPDGVINVAPGSSQGLAFEGAGELNILSVGANNTVIDAHGGPALRFEGSCVKRVRISGVTIRKAQAALVGCGTLILDASIISGSVKALDWSSGDATLTACDIRDSGGPQSPAVQFSSPSPTPELTFVLRIRRSVFTGNRATQGGAIHSVVGTVDLDGVTFVGNHASQSGGAIYVSQYSALRAVNTTFSGNVADESGGAVYIESPWRAGYRHELSFTTLTDNRADANRDGTGTGGALAVEDAASVWLSQSILAGNVETTLELGEWIPTAGECSGPLVTVGRSLFGVADCPVSGPAPLIGDANLGPLQNNGGLVPTHAPKERSAAIDAGSASCRLNPAVVARDQRGFARPTGSACDLGAVEAGAALVPKAKPHDVDGDGRADLVWRNDRGGNAVWLMNGSTPLDNRSLPAVVDSAWDVVAVDDFDGDGGADLLWHHVDGRAAIWFMSGARPREGAYLPRAWDGGWRIVGTGDFDGDQRADILWQAAARTMVWLLDGANVRVISMLPERADWVAVGVADVSGDQKSDIVWRRGSTGENTIWLMNGHVVGSVFALPRVAGGGWTISAVTDLNNDAMADILWHSPVTGANAVWFVSGGTVTGAGFLPTINPREWQITAVQDTDGDGRADIFWRSPDHRFARWRMAGLVIQTEGVFLELQASDAGWELQ